MAISTKAKAFHSVSLIHTFDSPDHNNDDDDDDGNDDDDDDVDDMLLKKFGNKICWQRHRAESNKIRL